MKAIRHLALTTLSVLALLLTLTAHADGKPLLQLTFDKCAVPDGRLVGTVEGECGVGEVVFTYLSVAPGKAIWQFSGEYAITTSRCSFKAVCDGTVDTRSGHIVLNGVVVTEGPYMGARVQVRAQANATLTCSSGRMTITPRRPN